MDTLKGNQASRLRASVRAILDSRLVGQSVQLCSDATRDAGLACVIRQRGVRRQGGPSGPVAHDRISPPRGGPPHYQWMLNHIREYPLCLAFGST
jgi:hypothetical protein